MTRADHMAAISALSGYTPKSAAMKMTQGVFLRDDPIETAAAKLRAHRITKQKPMSKPITPEMARRIIQYRQDGYGFAAIKRATGYSENACRAVIQGRPQARKREFESSYARYRAQTDHNAQEWEEKREECARLIRAGRTPAEIACELCVSQKRIVELRVQMGLGGRARDKEQQARAQASRERKAAEKLAAQTIADCPK